MKKWNSKYMNIITPCFFVVFIICSCYFMTQRDNYIESHGVWTIYKLSHVRFAPRGGLMARTYYKFKGTDYQDGTGISDDQKEGVGYFMVLLPESPAKKILYTGERVPSWFTLDAPPEGWPTKPTEAELREMMVQDSLKRGLKRTLGIDTEIENNEEVGQ